MQEGCEVGERLDKEVCDALTVSLGAHWDDQKIYDYDTVYKNLPQEGCTMIMRRNGWSMWYQENVLNPVGVHPRRFPKTNMMKVCSGSAEHQVRFFDMVRRNKSCKTKVKWGRNECIIAGLQVVVAAGKGLRRFIDTDIWPANFPHVPLGCSIRTQTGSSGYWDVYFSRGLWRRRNHTRVRDHIWTRSICADKAIEARSDAHTGILAAEPLEKLQAPSSAAALVVAERPSGGRRLGDAAATTAKAAHHLEGRSAAGARHEGNGTALLEGNGTALLESGCTTLGKFYCMDAGCTACSNRRRHDGKCRWYSDCVCCFPSCL